MCKFYFIVVALFIGSSLYGHGDLHERILKVTKEIKNHPNKANLYLKRATLYFQHEDFKKSIEDFNSCATLGHESDRLHIGFAKSYNSLGEFDLALSHLDIILRKSRHHVKALRLKGNILMDIFRYNEAGNCFDSVLEHAKETFTENYMEASIAWQRSDDLYRFKKSINAIEQGIETLGTLVVFLDRLINLNMEEAKYNVALGYQTQKIEISNRKEVAYYGRAVIQLKKGDTEAAGVDLNLAIRSIESLPQRIQNNASIINLRIKVKKLLSELK